MKITLRNAHLLESIRDDEAHPSSIDDILDRRETLASLKDSGINGFKEITDLNNISFGHFIIIEKMLNHEGLKLEDRIEMLAPIILRPLDEAKIDNEDTKREEVHKEKVLDIPIGSIYGAFNRLMARRKVYLYKTYNGVIYGTLNEDEDDDEEEEEGTSVKSGDSAREFHNKKFFWSGLINALTGGDIFRNQEAVELMMYEVMPFFAERRSDIIVSNLEARARG